MVSCGFVCILIIMDVLPGVIRSFRGRFMLSSTGCVLVVVFRFSMRMRPMRMVMIVSRLPGADEHEVHRD